MTSAIPRPTVAVLGLGLMGAAFARNLARDGFPVHVWNRSADKARALQGDGVVVHAGAADAVAHAQVVLSVLSTAEATAAVVLGGGDGPAVLPALPAGAVFVQMGTIGLAATARLAQAFADHPALYFVDCPISGTRGPAENRAVTLFASSDRLGEQVPDRDAAAQAALDTVLAAIARKVLWLGPAGAGARMKLVVNAWLVSVMQGVAETAVLAHALGLAPAQVWAALDGGPLAAPYAKAKLDKIGAGDWSTDMAMKWGAKDAALALQALAEAGGEPAQVPGLAQIAALWRQAAEAGLAERDIASLYAWLEARVPA